MKFIIILFIGFLLQTQFISFQTKRQYVEATIFKTLASLCFVLVGLLSGNGSLVIAAQFAGLMGDVFLEIRRIVAVPTKVFVFGIIFFTVEHILLIASSFDRGISHLGPCILGGIALFAVLLFNVRYCLKNVSVSIRHLGVGYMLILSCMCVFALDAAISVPTAGNIMFTIGSIFFVCSDTLLVHTTFGNEKKWMHPSSLILYYAAQTMIALSLVI